MVAILYCFLNGEASPLRPWGQGTEFSPRSKTLMCRAEGSNLLVPKVGPPTDTPVMAPRTLLKMLISGTTLGLADFESALRKISGDSCDS